jgi:hypothetical protein
MSKVDPHTPNTNLTVLRNYISQLRMKKFQVEPCDKSTKKEVQKTIDRYFSSTQKGVVLIIEER